MLTNSFSTATFTAAAVASVAGRVSHASRVMPRPMSSSRSRSRSKRICGVSRWSTFSEVNAPAAFRAVPTNSIRVTTPGRMTFAPIR